MSAGTCNKINCGDGFQDLESVIMSLFGKDANGCYGLKIVQLDENSCANLSSLDFCGQIVTVEMAIKLAIVDDGCGGNALGVFFLTNQT